MVTEKKGTKKEARLTIPEVRFAYATLGLVGTAPYVQNKFSRKALDLIKATQEAGSTARGKKKHEPKDFQAAYEAAKHIAEEDWLGIPAPAFRNAAISACKLVGFPMTRAKLSIFIEADGWDRDDGTPLVRITKGEPKYGEHYVRNETGVVDLRARPMWMPGWEAKVRVRWDMDQFTLEDIGNLFNRVGQQVGVGEGRPDSKKSNGMGWGLFRVAKITNVQLPKKAA